MDNNQATPTEDIGVAFSLSEATQNDRLLLVFVRHLGCLFCKQQVQLLKPIADRRLVFISHGDLAAVREFKRMFAPEHRFVSDPGMELYVTFGMKKGSVGQMLSPVVLFKGFQAIRTGNHQTKANQDPWVLGGWVLIEVGGAPSLVHPTNEASEMLTKEDALRLLTQGE